MSWLGWGPATNPQYEELVGESCSQMQSTIIHARKGAPPLLLHHHRYILHIQANTVAEKYCSPLNLPYPQSEDIATALEVTDLIRSKTVLPKPAMQSLRRRVASKNGRVQMYAIGVSDIDHFDLL